MLIVLTRGILFPLVPRLALCAAVFASNVACYSPLAAYRGGPLPSGKRAIVFKRGDSVRCEALSLPCGQCIGCRLERSRQWAMRCLHESSLYARNCFLTLTFDEAHLPVTGSVDVRDFQLFMKRLRKAFPGERIRYFHCGEYGEKLGRPHYHACLFNFDFADKIIWSERNGFRLYRSPVLEEVWGQGHALIGDVTFDSAAYVARYIMKKVTGEPAAAHYGSKKPEYISMSRGGRVLGSENLGGIGKGWFDQFKSDIYPGDYAVVNGVKVRPPKFYDGLFEAQNPVAFAEIKSKRIARGKEGKVLWRPDGAVGVGEASAERLGVKERCKMAAAKSLVRPLEVSNDY